MVFVLLFVFWIDSHCLEEPREFLAAQDWRQFSLLELRVFSREVFERL